MPTDSQAAPISKGHLWTGRIMSALPVLMLLFSATMKFLKPAPVLENFTRLGYSEGVIFPLGVVEVACTLLYLIPRTSYLGAILLTGFLGGATATHLRAGEPFFIPIVLGMMVWGGLFFRDTRLRALIPLKS